MPFAALGPHHVHFEVTGPAGAPPLLLIHSLGASGHVFDPLRPALERTFRVVRYDLPGHGLSAPPAPGRPLGVAELAHSAAALLDALDLPRAHVLGLSLGGQVALALAAATPSRVDRLVLCATAARLGSAELWNERIDALKRGGLASLADAVLARWTAPDFAARAPAEAAGLRAMLLGTSSEGYAAGCAALRDADLRAACGSVTAPTLAIAGERDVAAPLADVQALAAAIRGARLVVIPGAAHLPVVERADAVGALVADFLAPAPAETLVELFERGLAVRQRVLGGEHVARALAGATDLDRDFQEFITRTAWGSVWARPGLDPRTRSLATIALLVALGRDEELELHLRASRNTGVEPRELAELLLHTAVYAGVPAANAAFRIAKRVLSDAPRGP
jgi:3-oxoadipate enol-lactonase/4-carboxymuconolactone decarboxylase